MKILLVDDDAFLRDMYATKFTEAGDDIAVAESGKEALGKMDESKFDAVVMDMVMPGMTGTELIKAIKTNQKNSTTACIVLSNQGEANDIEAAKKAGATGYIVKAESIPSEVVKKIHDLINN